MGKSLLVMSSYNKIDGSLKQKAYTFFEKLTEDDSLPGLHVEPVKNSADPRVRTGRVDEQYRAVLFRLESGDLPTYVVYGIWNHDDAYVKASSVTIDRNPVNGIVEIKVVEGDTATAPTSAAVAPAVPPEVEASATVPEPVLRISADELVTRLGMSADVARRAVAFTDEDELGAYLESVQGWESDALLSLWMGSSVEQVLSTLVSTGVEDETVAQVETTGPEGPASDTAILKSLTTPSSRMYFAPIDGAEELRRVIESQDFGAWRVFLHPEQRRWAEGSWGGPFRLAGGAGTGKTVVVLHRAKQLSDRHPGARVLVTTYTKNLAADLLTNLRRLDPSLPVAPAVGAPGVYVSGIDATASAVLRLAGAEVSESVAAVLGAGRTDIAARPPGDRWNNAVQAAGADLPDSLRSPTFIQDEYELVILPNRIVDETTYLKARRPGRGVRLSRADRSAVWAVVEAYRNQARADGQIDFAEAAMIAATYLEQRQLHLADHVLVDEGQDLSPAHWTLVRALVTDGRDDIFIAEDSHQRIYGHRLTLSRFGINTRGRSRRLTLNYRTTRENLAWAVKVLEGGSYSDLDEGDETTAGYRSARSGGHPLVEECESLNDELSRAAEIITGWLDEGDVAETIAVLVRDHRNRDLVVNGLHERGVRVRAIDGDTVRAGQPVVATMHRAKGMEFARVLLFEVSAKSIPMGLRNYAFDEAEAADALLRERSLLYVAASRARDTLVVLWSGKRSPLLGQ